MLKPPTKRQEIAAVLTAAVRAYSLARRRTALQKAGMAGRKAAKQLADEFPESYSAHGAAKNLVFTGKSADEIIEEYLQEEKRGSREWQRLAALVVYHGEKAERTS
jgi:uroporphyrinogen-III synthase